MIEATAEQRRNEATTVPVTMTPKEAAAIAGVNARTITRLCAAGKIKAAQFGRVWRVNRAAFMRYIGECE